MKRIAVLGGGISGYGSAILAKKKGFDVFLSDMLAVIGQQMRRLYAARLRLKALCHLLHHSVDLAFRSIAVKGRQYKSHAGDGAAHFTHTTHTAAKAYGEPGDGVRVHTYLILERQSHCLAAIIAGLEVLPSQITFGHQSVPPGTTSGAVSTNLAEMVISLLPTVKE